MLLGAFLLRTFLKTFQCYPKTIRGTARDSPARQRALIATIPVTIGYEVTHTKIALIHFIAALAMSMPNMGQEGDAVKRMLGVPLLVLNLVIIYAIHVLPVLVQRGNRAWLYNAIAVNQENGVGVILGSLPNEEQVALGNAELGDRSDLERVED